MFQFHSQNCCLKRIQAKVSSNKTVMILRLATVNPKHLYNFSQLFIIGKYHSGITESTEILAGKEGKTTDMPYCSGLPSPIIASTDRLGRIFDHLDTFVF